ncbi:hypothetical protein HU200_023806 [Digitaria exilis]|uniref:BTB domain-containing protein n=1 Tax=Digitaria exilis TaxID=1010633 RepID=A0A835EYB1_9POAL|nr:hypothetical protein HU200_023806 [Digitaria exilis]
MHNAVVDHRLGVPSLSGAGVDTDVLLQLRDDDALTHPLLFVVLTNMPIVLPREGYGVIDSNIDDFVFLHVAAGVNVTEARWEHWRSRQWRRGRWVVGSLLAMRASSPLGPWHGGGRDEAERNTALDITESSPLRSPGHPAHQPAGRGRQNTLEEATMDDDAHTNSSIHMVCASADMDHSPEVLPHLLEELTQAHWDASSSSSTTLVAAPPASSTPHVSAAPLPSPTPPTISLLDAPPTRAERWWRGNHGGGTAGSRRGSVSDARSIYSWRHVLAILQQPMASWAHLVRKTSPQPSLPGTSALDLTGVDALHQRWLPSPHARVVVLGGACCRMSSLSPGTRPILAKTSFVSNSAFNQTATTRHGTKGEMFTSTTMGALAYSEWSCGKYGKVRMDDPMHATVPPMGDTANGPIIVDVDFPPMVSCCIVVVRLMAVSDTNEVFAKIRLVPGARDDLQQHAPPKPTAAWFAKTLGSTERGEVKPTKITCLPKRDYFCHPPSRLPAAPPANYAKDDPLLASSSGAAHTRTEPLAMHLNKRDGRFLSQHGLPVARHNTQQWTGSQRASGAQGCDTAPSAWTSEAEAGAGWSEPRRARGPLPRQRRRSTTSYADSGGDEGVFASHGLSPISSDSIIQCRRLAVPLLSGALKLRLGHRPQFGGGTPIELKFIKTEDLERSVHALQGRLLHATSRAAGQGAGLPADVRFRVERKTLAAHRCVLAARSPVFSAELYTVWDELKESHTDHVVADVFKSLLHFIYTDFLPETAMEEGQEEDDACSADRFEYGKAQVDL